MSRTATKQLKLGWSPSWDLDMGSLIHGAHADKVMGHIEEAVAKRGPRAGRRTPPSAIWDRHLWNPRCSPMSAIARRFRHRRLLVRWCRCIRSRAPMKPIVVANDSDYGLNASVWAGDSGEAMDVARQIDAGSVGINSTLMIYNAFDVPMGGIKQSGIGRRHGEHGILRYTQEQSIVTSFSTGGGYDSMLGKIRSPKTGGRSAEVCQVVAENSRTCGRSALPCSRSDAFGAARRSPCESIDDSVNPIRRFRIRPGPFSGLPSGSADPTD